MTAYSYETAGAVLPVRVAGDVALDFCNTAAGWNAPPKKDYLRSYDELVLWARDAGLVELHQADRLRELAREKPHHADSVMCRALALREALHETALGGDAWHGVAAEAERAAREARLTPSGWQLPERLDLPVLAIARAAADFLLGPDRDAVRACPGRHCGWLFVDRRRRRRWCSMAACGNREKQRRHAERARAA